MNTKTLIIGAGKTSLSVAKFLSEQAQPFSFFEPFPSVASLGALKQQCPEAALETEQLTEASLQGVKAVVISPGIDPRLPVFDPIRQAGLAMVGDIALFARHANAPIIGITGSNGKTTVTTMVSEIAKAAGLNVPTGGNIGTPALALLTTPAPDYYLLELSSFQLDATPELPLAIAALLNLSPDHLDRYDSYTDYVNSKQHIFKQCETAVFSAVDGATIPTVSVTQKAVFNDQGVGVFRHDRLNSAAAACIATEIGIDQKVIRQVLTDFATLPHRCERVCEKDGVLWVNDSKATNVGAAQSGIESVAGIVPGKIVLIAGGRDKGSDFGQLSSTLTRYCRAVVLLGEASEQMASYWSHLLPVETVDSLEAAVTAAEGLAQAGDSVLLAPACTSWDMFKNYQERGAQFKALCQAS